MTPHTSYVTVTDQFCGAGGSSIGAVAAGAELRLALNHWKLAIALPLCNATNPSADGIIEVPARRSQHLTGDTGNLIAAGCGDASIPLVSPLPASVPNGGLFVSTSQKRCRVCGADKPFFDFYKRPDAPDGLRSECKTCTKARSRASVERDPERRATYMAAYTSQNREKLARQSAERAQRQPRLGYYRTYRAANLSRLHENERAYRNRHPDRVAARRHERRALGIDQEAKAYIAILLNDPCSYCGGPGGTIDHIVPVAVGGTNHWTNLTSACPSCNSRKHDLSLIAFLARCTNGA